MTDPRVLITENLLVNDHVEYRVVLQKANGTRISSICRRYREFTELHAQLQRFSQPFKVPPMPPKKFFGRTNPSFVRKRQLELQIFLDKLFSLMLMNPHADTAWRLLCLFLSVDQNKHQIPSSLVSYRSDITNASVDNSYVDINNDQGVRDIRNALESNGVDPSRYVGLDEEDMQTRTAEAIENQRLSDLVDAFESQCINVCRGFENRSRNPNLPSLSVDIDELATAIKEHILTAPLFNPPNVSELSEEEIIAAATVEGENDEVQDDGEAAGNENDPVNVSLLARRAKDLHSALSVTSEDKPIAAESLIFHL
mmetsp:Transcript_11279/g.12927  ORF Transcript_11279/g.12927 Transcript_11279/m.12927 type:complete len:312 (-) Transcript_11279:981-1916(-)|eukprot:CAMPEP_0184018666 /NCGR_PEP_ID=MMETSP0954-20121128/8278_1 /TAXON_ID=627963 /ORGANISM="Aplanochytrium sp, Strain PBS07" /LENGTH=311 /DNA_ID=CAMNT_0026300157 /DNA_START=197 /DNA_END=1132 /DNA_ORIENTATION=-